MSGGCLYTRTFRQVVGAYILEHFDEWLVVGFPVIKHIAIECKCVALFKKNSFTFMSVR